MTGMQIMQQMDATMQHLSAARKVIGYANAGLPVSATVADTTLKRLTRSVNDAEMTITRGLLREIASGAGLPPQHRCEQGRKEVEAMRSLLKQTMTDMMRQGEAEEDAPRPGA